MGKDIAVFIDRHGHTAELNEQGKLVVYQKQAGVWQAIREKDFCLDKKQGLRTLRSQMNEMLDFLGECKTFAGRSVTGVPYFELEKANVSVWEIEGQPLALFEHILASQERQALQTEQAEKPSIPVPVETANGCYFISIKDIQENNAGVTSKQVLLPFLRKGVFYELTVLCNHLPPWLEGELAAGGLISKIEKLSNKEIRVTIVKKSC